MPSLADYFKTVEVQASTEVNITKRMHRFFGSLCRCLGERFSVTATRVDIEESDMLEVAHLGKIAVFNLEYKCALQGK